MLASILTGLFTLAAAAITLFLQERHQRAMAREERLWSRQAETYVALLQYQYSGVAEGPYGITEDWRIRDELTAKAAAFASVEVRELWRKSAWESSALNTYVREEWPQWSTSNMLDRLDVEEEMEQDATFREIRQASSEAEKRLAEQIRAELGSSRQRRSAPLRKTARDAEDARRSAHNPATTAQTVRATSVPDGTVNGGHQQSTPGPAEIGAELGIRRWNPGKKRPSNP